MATSISLTYRLAITKRLVEGVQKVLEALMPGTSAAANALAGRNSGSSTKKTTSSSIASVSKAAATASVTNAAREQDNYLVCSEYQERVKDSKHDQHADVIVFKHANGLNYFATLDSQNNIALRSESYPSTGARDNGLKSVLRNREMRARFKLEENRGLHFTCLRAGNHQEIGRSCKKKTKQAANWLIPGVAAAASLGLAAKASIPTPAPQTVPPPKPVVASCNCNAQTHPVFNIPNRSPLNITRLGTAPEFGNSHSLSLAEFLAKLQRRAANSSADRSFLNGIAKAMGYGSFSDLGADEFSSVTLDRGTTGNLGSTSAHKTIYATLNTSGQDLKAFRIKAANGCDLHFMKTCGNHMFFCPK